MEEVVGGLPRTLPSRFGGVSLGPFWLSQSFLIIPQTRRLYEVQIVDEWQAK